MNNGTACFYLSGMYISGVTKNQETPNSEIIIPKDMEKAFMYAQKACELRNMYACANLSQMYKNGDGTAKNLTLSEKYKKIAMEMQDEFKNQQQLNFQQGLPSV
uniref:CSON008345 protein n=1 Tax=Culicoides sonorensis TaxID=179676 RepID=A0A336LBW5_CULSO